MPVNVPAEIIRGGFFPSCGCAGQVGGHLVFEAALANISQQALPPGIRTTMAPPNVSRG